jgi:predicted enzyme related to lactoylglutathione lyase
MSQLQGAVPLGTILIYARDVEKSALFYSQHFGFETSGALDDGLIVLTPAAGGAAIMIHPAAKSLKLGQAAVKLTFHVVDIPAFVASAAEKGLRFGALHHARGYMFANAKDPDGNSISVSSRVFRKLTAPGED